MTPAVTSRRISKVSAAELLADSSAANIWLRQMCNALLNDPLTVTTRSLALVCGEALYQEIPDNHISIPLPRYRYCGTA